MIKIDGRHPDLSGIECEELICQQYHHNGRLNDEADVVFLKFSGAWHQLYFDGGVVHWRLQSDAPQQREADSSGVFSYPLVNLGESYGIRGQKISPCQVMETSDGETLTLQFETGAWLQFKNSGDTTQVHFKGFE